MGVSASMTGGELSKHKITFTRAKPKRESRESHAEWVETQKNFIIASLGGGKKKTHGRGR